MNNSIKVSALWILAIAIVICWFLDFQGFWHGLFTGLMIIYVVVLLFPIVENFVLRGKILRRKKK